MVAQRRLHTSRGERNRYRALLVLMILCSWMLVGATFRPIRAASSGDLMSDVPVVDENTLNNAACGIASATMILDYYLPQSGPIHQAIDIGAVARYVGENYRYDVKTNRQVPVGTTTDQLQTGLEAASTAPSLHFGVPLTASWHTTENANWFSVLQTELDAKQPVVLFIPNGGNLGWSWNYGHFIAVSGYNSDGSIIYHDPWDGKAHTLPQSAFGSAWGTAWAGNPAWWYMEAKPTSTTPGPTITVTSQPTTVAMPPTQTSCPPDGQGRAAVVEPVALGTDQNIVYIDDVGTLDNPVSGALQRYDVHTGKTTNILTLPSTFLYEAQVSTDGQWILLVSDMNGVAAIQQIRMDGQGLQTLYCAQAQNLSDVQWSPDQMSIAFAVIGGTSFPETTISLLNTRNGQLRTLASSQGPQSSCCVQLSWLDTTHLSIIGAQGLTGTPDLGNPLLLDTSQQGIQQLDHLSSIFQPGMPASGSDSFGEPCYDFANSSDQTQLFISQCWLTRYFPMAMDDVIQEGPGSISVEPVMGGPTRTIYSNPGLAIAAIQTISPTRLLFYADNYSSHAGQSVDTSQNGLWTINTNGTGLTHLTTAAVGETGYFFFQIPTPAWLVVSRDGSMYASSTHDFSSGDQSLFFGSLNGGTPTTFLSRQFVSTPSGSQNGDITLVGWTSM